jgi:hypothetical protein
MQKDDDDDGKNVVLNLSLAAKLKRNAMASPVSGENNEYRGSMILLLRVSGSHFIVEMSLSTRITYVLITKTE